jgi:ABC-type multidrug transport system ATPase subunit
VVKSNGNVIQALLKKQLSKGYYYGSGLYYILGAFMKNKIEIYELTKTFPLPKKQRTAQKKEKMAVNDISFFVKEGETFGLLGNNGAGKTTTLRILATLIKPTSGKILIDGIDVAENPEQIRKKIGFLTSELKLEDFFTPDYLFDYFSNLYGVSKQESEKRKAELFSKLDIQSFSKTRISKLSTGMKQKVSLAISMSHDPDIIIFDEPTNGLDIISSRVIMDYLIELKKAGKTIIISSHIFSIIERACDRVGIMIDGKLKYCDTISNATSKNSLEDTFFHIYEKNRERIK